MILDTAFTPYTTMGSSRASTGKALTIAGTASPQRPTHLLRAFIDFVDCCAALNEQQGICFKLTIFVEIGRSELERTVQSHSLDQPTIFDNVNGSRRPSGPDWTHGYIKFFLLL